jgi:hypothetical protein
MRTHKEKYEVDQAEVPAVLTEGSGLWLLLTCENGHLISQFRHGDWSDARKKYGRANATVLCPRCYNENGKTHQN